MIIERLKAFGTKVGSEEQIELDEVSILASPNDLKTLGKFLIESAEDM